MKAFQVTKFLIDCLFNSLAYYWFCTIVRIENKQSKGGTLMDRVFKRILRKLGSWSFKKRVLSASADELFELLARIKTATAFVSRQAQLMKEVEDSEDDMEQI